VRPQQYKQSLVNAGFAGISDVADTAWQKVVSLKY
jgi:hypothetical protein